MKALGTVTLILFILPLAAIAHDLYLYYEESSLNPQAIFQLSDFGYLLLTYAKDIHDQLFSLVGAEDWENYVRPILTLPSFFVLGIPFAISLVSYIICAIIKLPMTVTAAIAKAKKRAQFDNMYH